MPRKRDVHGRYLCRKTKSNRGANLRNSNQDTSSVDHISSDHCYTVGVGLGFDHVDDENAVNDDNVATEVEVEGGLEDWRIGRRIVELDVLAKNMFCNQCSMPLLLSNTVSEQRCGLGSILQICCQNGICNALSPVETGKRSKGAR